VRRSNLSYSSDPTRKSLTRRYDPVGLRSSDSARRSKLRVTYLIYNSVDFRGRWPVAQPDPAKIVNLAIHRPSIIWPIQPRSYRFRRFQEGCIRLLGEHSLKRMWNDDWMMLTMRIFRRKLVERSCRRRPCDRHNNDWTRVSATPGEWKWNKLIIIRWWTGVRGRLCCLCVFTSHIMLLLCDSFNCNLCLMFK